MKSGELVKALICGERQKYWYHRLLASTKNGPYRIESNHSSGAVLDLCAPV